MKIQTILLIYSFLIAKSFINELKTNHNIRMLEVEPTSLINGTESLNLIGFGGYNKTKIPNKDTYKFQLKVFFQKIFGYDYKEFLLLKLKLKRGYLRGLDGDGDYINVAAKLNKESLSWDIIQYDIDADGDGKGYEDFDKIDVDTKMKFQNDEPKIEDYNFENCDDVKIMTEIENINEQNLDKDSLYFLMF